ncbi:MAG: hypothetical protein B6I28_01425 [Fusobacteriia bacterium 4572_132]|nr:MAG: hypothetical protein B6I28_01425 [Fusobacteriia bacterium 4572_132]
MKNIKEKMQKIQENIVDGKIKSSLIDELIDDLECSEEEYEMILKELLEMNVEIVEKEKEVLEIVEEIEYEEEEKYEVYDIDMIKQYFQEISRYKLLSKEEEKQLIIKSKAGDEVAMEKLVMSNLRLVAKLTLEYISPGTFFLDLVQDGTIGLLEGIKRFDLTKEYRLSTYASWWIKKELIKSLKSKINSVKIPNYIFTTYRKINLADRKISQEKGNRATNEEIASYLEMDIKEVLNIKKIINSKLITINGDVSDNNFAIELEDNNTEKEINENIEKMNRDSKIAKMLKSLNRREKEIIMDYFGLDNGEKQTYKEIGTKLDLSAERVRVLKDRALRKLRYAGAKIKND